MLLWSLRKNGATLWGRTPTGGLVEAVDFNKSDELKNRIDKFVGLVNLLDTYKIPSKTEIIKVAIKEAGLIETVSTTTVAVEVKAGTEVNNE